MQQERIALQIHRGEAAGDTEVCIAPIAGFGATTQTCVWSCKDHLLVNLEPFLRLKPQWSCWLEKKCDLYTITYDNSAGHPQDLV
jgi:hypothetical protein